MSIDITKLRNASRVATQKTNAELEFEIQSFTTVDIDRIIARLDSNVIPQVDIDNLKGAILNATNKNQILLSVINNGSLLAKELKGIITSLI